MTTAHVGGLDGRWLFLITGDAVRQLSEFETHLATGAVIASPQAWAAADGRLIGQPADGGRVRVQSVREELPAAVARLLTLTPELEPVIRSYTPRSAWLG